jgi:hypothetical protein
MQPIISVGLLAALLCAAPAAAQITPTKRYLLSFHACDGSACSNPQNHRVYLAESDDGAAWTLVPGWTTYAGSVPDVIQRGRTLYIYTANTQVARYNLDTGASDRVVVQVSGLPAGTAWVDPSLFVDDRGRLVMFMLYASQMGSDPAGCPTGVTSCTKQILSATEVAGSNGSQFTVNGGDRATMTVGSSTGLQSGSDPDIFFDGTQFVLYVSHGTSTSVWTSSTLHGTYTRSSTLPSGLLSNGSGGIAAGSFDTSSSRYWTFAHLSQGGSSVIRRAIHANLTQQLTESSWTTAVSGSGLGLGSTTSVESPGFATLTTGLPTAPSNLASTVSGSTATLTWNASANAASYDVEVGSRSGATDIATLSATDTAVSGAAPSGTYYVRVRGRNALGVSAASSEIVVTVGSACPALTAPNPLSATVSGSLVTLVWGGVGGATSYVLEAGSASGATDVVTVDLGTTATSFAGTAGHGTYYVRVRAKNGCGTGSASNEVIVNVP